MNRNVKIAKELVRLAKRLVSKQKISSSTMCASDGAATKMFVKRDELEKWNKWLQENEIDFDKVDFPYDATLFSQTVEFDDGTQADLKVCSGQTNLWCEMVWFDKDGHEIACSDADADGLDGVWECSLDDKYNVEVIGR